jgi:Zn-dependent M28 family amino/carboxypeptidase
MVTRSKTLWRAPQGVLCVLALLSGCTVQPTLPPPTTDIDETAYRNALWLLASDQFEGRKPGTPGADKTVAFLADHFRNLGLKPGNESGKPATFFQQVPLIEVTPGADAHLTVLGQSGARPLPLGQEAVIWSKRAVPEVHLQRSDLIFVGFGTVAPEYSWDDYADIDVHGKTVLVLMGDPGVAGPDAGVFKGRSLTEYGRWEYKVEEAARHGAAGVLLVHDAARLGYGWNAVQSTWGGAQFELPAADSYAGRTAIEGWLRSDAVRTLFADAGLDFSALSAAAARPGFKAVPMRCKVDATLHNSLRPFNSQNVVALWPGGKHKDEYVLYTAHWDGLGVDPQPSARNGHAVFDGAVDNATGAAGLLVLAQSFVRTKPVPDRSMVFLATTAGEVGNLGAIFYAENPLFPLRRTAAVIDVDGLLPGGHARDLAVFGNGNSDMEDTARALALLQGRETHPDPFPELGLYYRSDAYIFARYGVPALLAQSGLDDAARGPAWGRAERQDYLANRYHQPSDSYSPDWNVVGAIDDLTLYYELGLRVASSRRFPRWYPNSQFRGSHRRVPASEAEAD